MLSTKFIATLLGFALAIYALCSVNLNSQPVVENWWGGIQFTTTAVPYTCQDGVETAVGGNYLDTAELMDNNKFVSTPNFQAVISPRFDNNQYGAYIRYNTPDRANMAAPCDPLTFGDMAKENYVPTKSSPTPMHIQSLAHGSSGGSPSGVQENYCGGNGCSDSGLSCGKGGYGFGHKVAGGYELPANYTNGNYQDVYDSLPGTVVSRPCSSDCGTSSADLPIGTMSSMDSSGNIQQTVVNERLMVANIRDRNLQGSDYIRGDLAIAPCQTGWFSVYPKVNTALNPGAMRAMFGSGESTNDLYRLMSNASGGSITTFGGTNLAETPNYSTIMSGTVTGALVDGASTPVFTAFP